MLCQLPKLRNEGTELPWHGRSLRALPLTSWAGRPPQAQPGLTHASSCCIRTGPSQFPPKATRSPLPGRDTMQPLSLPSPPPASPKHGHHPVQSRAAVPEPAPPPPPRSRLSPRLCSHTGHAARGDCLSILGRRPACDTGPWRPGHLRGRPQAPLGLGRSQAAESPGRGSGGRGAPDEDRERAPKASSLPRRRAAYPTAPS